LADPVWLEGLDVVEELELCAASVSGKDAAIATTRRFRI
jgi:hypothetical protein